MEFSDNEVLDFIEEKLGTTRTTGEKLSNIERILLTTVWGNPRRKYYEIAEAEGYSQSYIHNVAAQLWKDLSGALDASIGKSNMKATVSRLMLQERQRQATVLNQPMRHDFGNWMGAIEILGRDREQQQLADCLSANQTRVVRITGITGIGKSCLCETAVRQLAHQFPVILCRSLRSQISLSDILHRLIHLVEPETHLTTTSVEDMLPIALQSMQQQRCLLILEDFDAIAQPGYLAQQEAALYQRFLQQVNHLTTGCVVILSRINTELLNWSVWQRATCLLLKSLSAEDNQRLMERHGALPSASLLVEIQAYYGDHPRYLTAVAQQVHGILAGAWPYFWESLAARLLQSVRDCLEADYHHLSPIEQDVMHWLVVAGKPLSIDYLQVHVPRATAQTDWIHAVSQLCDRAFIQMVNVVNHRPVYAPIAIWRDFITQRLLSSLVDELQTGAFELLHSLPIRSAHDSAIVIQFQTDQLILPLLNRLNDLYGSTQQLKQRLKSWLEDVCERRLAARLYTAGNLINLCQAAAVDVGSLDFSDLDIRNADLRQISLGDCAGRHTRLRDCAFTVPLAGKLTLALDTQGQHLATSESSGPITVWQVETAAPLRIFHDDQVCSLAFHPQQSVLAYGTAMGAVSLADWRASSSAVTVRKIHDAPITALSFSADGEVLAIGDRSGRVFLWHQPLQANSRLQELPLLAEQANLPDLPRQSMAIRQLTWSADGQQLASSNSYAGLLWDRQTDTVSSFGDPNFGRIRSLMFEDHSLYAAVTNHTSLSLWGFSADWLVATVEENASVTSAYLWRTQAVSQMPEQVSDSSTQQSAKQPSLSKQSTDPSIYLAYIRDDQLILKAVSSELSELDSMTVALNTPLALSGDGQRLAVMPSAHCIQVWQMPSASIPAASPVATASTASSVAASTVPPTASPISMVQQWLGYSCPVQAYAFDPTAKLLAVGNRDGSLRVWDLDAGRCRHLFRGLHTRICAIAVSPDGQQMASSDRDGHLWLWDLANGQPLQSLEGHHHEIQALAFHPQQPLLASSSTSGTVRLWHTTRGTTQHVFRQRDGFTHLVFSPNGNHLVGGDRQGTICVWDWHTNQLLREWQAHDGSAVEYLGFTPAGYLVSAGRNHRVCRWDESYRTETELFKDADFYISHVSCPDEQHVWILGWRAAADGSDKKDRKDRKDRKAQLIQVTVSTPNQSPTTNVMELPFLHQEEQLLFTPNGGIASLHLGDRFQLWGRIDPLSPLTYPQPDLDLLLNSPYQGFRLTHSEGLSPEQMELLRRLGASL